MMRRYGLTLLLWFLALGLAGWTLSKLPLNAIAAQVGALGAEDWSIWVLLNMAILSIAVKRWQVLGQALRTPLSFALLFRLRQAGSAVSFLTPGPHFGGEPLQLYWLNRDAATPMHRAIAMLGMDRFMETATNIAVLLGGVLILLGTALVPTREWLQVLAILGGVLALMLVLVAVVLRHPDWLAQRFQPLTRRWQTDRNQGAWQALVRLLREAMAQHKSRLWWALLLSLLGWAALLLELVLLMRLLGVSPSLMDVVLIMVSMRLAMLLPAPGGIGTIEASLLWSFQLLGIPVSVAVGLIALIRLRDATVLLIGLACLWSFQRPGLTAERVSAE